MAILPETNDCHVVPQVCARLDAIEKDLDTLEDRVASATLRKAIPWGAILMAIAGSAGDWIPAVVRAVLEALQ